MAKKYDPAKLLKRKRLKHRTLCDTIREIYHNTDDPDIKKHCKEAIVYAKKMNDRLMYYRKRYNTESIEKELYG